jgi:uncharacterized protein YcfJ
MSTRLELEIERRTDMKRLALAVGALFTAIAPAAFADPYGPDYSRDYGQRNSDDFRHRDSARVIESRPVYAGSESRQECWNPRAGHYEELREPEKTRIGKGAAIGAVAGGVLGHQVDSGGGTAAGAILGGILGHQVERRNDRDEQGDLDRSRCRYVSAGNDRLEGYDVRYEYGGREYVTRLSHDPGNRLRLGRDIDTDGTPY